MTRSFVQFVQYNNVTRLCIVADDKKAGSLQTTSSHLPWASGAAFPSSVLRQVCVQELVEVEHWGLKARSIPASKQRSLKTAPSQQKRKGTSSFL